MIRKLLRTLGVWLLLAAVPVIFLLSKGIQGYGEKDSDPWGSESLVESKRDLEYLLKHTISIPLANACGLGATSCFKCHSGSSAVAPSAKPWHLDHKRVNFSCNGCHKGNPRLIAKELAHTKMIPNPLTQPENTCASCHMGQDIGRLVNKYKGIKQSFRYDPHYALHANMLNNIGR